MTVREILDYYGIYYEEDLGSSELLVLCPFHSDQTLGSAKFNEESEVFHCFSCDAGGNKFQFVAKLENITVKEAQNLIRNLFQKERYYDIERVKKSLDKVKSKGLTPQKSVYVRLADSVVMKISKELSARKVAVEILQKWLTVCNWIRDTKDFETKEKQVLTVYQQFLTELQTI